MKNILVPTDFSDEAKNALRYAIKIAQAMNSKIVLYYSLSPMAIASDMGTYVFNQEENFLHSLDDKMDRLLDFVQSKNVSVERIIEKGLLGDEIAEVTEKERIDLVVTGTHGAKGIEALLFGTTSELIFEKVKCPVLIIPSHARFHGIEKMMYATDYNYKESKEIARVSKLASAFKAELIVAHIDLDLNEFIRPSDAMDWFSELVENNIHYGKITYKRFYGQNVQEAIRDSVEDLDIDVLCMSTQEKNFFANLFHKSNTRTMAFHTRVPLMLLHSE